MTGAISLKAAVLGRCPACGEGRLFDGFLKVRSACGACGRDFSAVATGDGAATFIMQIAGGIVAFTALAVEIAYSPPIWLHLIVWVPLVGLLSLALMRPAKGLMIALHLRNNVREADHGGV